MTRPSLAEAKCEAEPAISSLALFYDHGCPACRFYSTRLRLTASVAPLQLIDVRTAPSYLTLLTAQGFNLDQGMVLKVGEAWYSGAAALHMLAILSSRSNAFNRMQYWLFKSATRSRFLYPPLRAARNLLLWLLGKPKIHA